VPVSFSPEALAEAEDAAYWYRAQGGNAASESFTQEVERVARLAGLHPELGGPGAHSTRRLYLKRFPYTLIFRIQSDTVRIIAVAHQRRRPGYWAGRQ
jgi:plasmid stabilization system protein ParE